MDILTIVKLIIRLIGILLLYAIGYKLYPDLEWSWVSLYLLITQVALPALFDGEDREYDGEMKIVLEEDESTTYMLSVYEDPKFNEKDDIYIKIRRD